MEAGGCKINQILLLTFMNINNGAKNNKKNQTKLDTKANH